MYEILKQTQYTNWWFKARREIVYKCLRKYISGNIHALEIGAGYGVMTNMLKSFGTVQAVEPYLDAVDFLRGNLDVNTYAGTLDTFSGTEKYDLVACFDVLEHIADDKAALMKIESLIYDNGLLVLTVPAYMFLWGKHDELNGHLRRYTKGNLVEKMPCSFSIKKASYFNTLLFPVALLDRLLFSKNKRSYSLNPNKFINGILYILFSLEKYIIPFINLPFGISILVIAKKIEYKGISFVPTDYKART